MKTILCTLGIVLGLTIGQTAAQQRQPFEGTLVQKVNSYVHIGNTGTVKHVMFQKIKGDKFYSIQQTSAGGEFNRSIYDFSGPDNAVAYAVAKLASGQYAACKLVFPHDKTAIEAIKKLFDAQATETVEKFGFTWERRQYKDADRSMDGYVLKDYYHSMGPCQTPLSLKLSSEIKPYTTTSTEILSIKAEPVSDDTFSLPEGTAVFDNVQAWTNYVLKENTKFQKKDPKAFEQFLQRQNAYLKEAENAAEAQITEVPEAIWDF